MILELERITSIEAEKTNNKVYHFEYMYFKVDLKKSRRLKTND